MSYSLVYFNLSNLLVQAKLKIITINWERINKWEIKFNVKLFDEIELNEKENILKAVFF